MQRVALIFTVIVFAALVGGVLSRRPPPGPPDLRRFDPESAPIFPALVDPLDVARTAGAPRTDRLELVVRDHQGVPVAGAAVVVRAGASALWAFTDAQGRATLEGLAPGSSRLAVLAFPHPPLELDVAPEPSARTLTLGPPATLPQPLPDMPRSRLAGRIVRPAGAARCEVLLLPSSAPEVLGAAFPRSAHCDGDGRFVLEDLAHGAYQVKVLPDWAAGGTWPDLAARAQRELVFAGEARELLLELEAGEIAGLLRDDQGRILEGALVHAQDLASENHLWPAVSSDKSGEFRIADLPPGRYRVTCRAGEGGSSAEVDVRAGEVSQIAVPAFSARKRP